MAEKKETKKVEEVKEETKKTTKKTTKNKTTRKKVKQIDRNEMIPCKNVTDNKVLYISPRTGLRYQWNSYGDIEYIEFGELLTMRSAYPKFLNEPWIIPEDEEVIELLRLSDVYDRLIPLDDLERFFRNQLDDIREAIRKAPNGNKKSLAIKTREMIENETLYDSRIIKLLEKELKIDLRVLMD